MSATATRSVGRPSKYNQETVRTILEVLSDGGTRTIACQCAGITLETLGNWERDYLDFFDALKTAEGRCAHSLLQKVKTAAQDPSRWTAAAWMLERRFQGYQQPKTTNSFEAELSNGADGPKLKITVSYADSEPSGVLDE